MTDMTLTINAHIAVIPNAKLLVHILGTSCFILFLSFFIHLYVFVLYVLYCVVFILCYYYLLVLILLLLFSNTLVNFVKQPLILIFRET